MPVGKWTPEREAALTEWQQKWRPLWQELRDAVLASAPDVGGVMSFSTMHYGLRTFFTLRERDYITGTAAALYRDQLWPYWFTEDGTLKGLNQFKLIVVPPSGASVMTARLADALERYVAEGGRLVLFPDSGKWVVEEPDRADALLRRVGWTQPDNAANAAFSAVPEGNSGLPATATAAVAPVAAHVKAASKLFPSTQPLVFNRTMQIPRGNSDIEATLDDGSPAVVSWAHGQGQVVLFTGTPVWDKVPGMMASLYKWAGGQRDEGTNNPSVELNHLCKGTTHYVILHRLTDSFRPQPPILDRATLRSQPSLSVKWHVSGLPAGSWKITELATDKPETTTCSTQQLTDGMPIDLYLAQTRVFKLEPISTTP
jgi:hypothetical protein